jgi:DivIVA domain-containing protein
VDRDRIERRDFPTGRRGYDPAAVDEHLRRVADEFEARVHAPGASISDSTSEQVRLILRAAEDGAAKLRAAAGSEASDHVTRVQTAADGMLTKLDALESELTRLLTALRASGERLVDGLAELQAEASGAVTPPADERRVTPAQFERIDSQDRSAAAADPSDPRGDAAPTPLAPVDVPPAAAPPESSPVADVPPAAASPVPAESSPAAEVPPAADMPPAVPAADAPPAADASPVVDSLPAVDAPLSAAPDADPKRAATAPPGTAPPVPADTLPTADLPLAAESPISADSPAAADVPAAAASTDPADSPPAADPSPPAEPPATSAAYESPPLSAPGAPDWPAPAEALFADVPPAVSDEESEDESARLVALNMALNGSPRDDTRAFLAEHFSLPDLEGLLDDVYARAGR